MSTSQLDARRRRARMYPVRMKVMLLAPHLSGGGGERVVSDLSCTLRADELVLVVFEKKFTYPCKGRVISLDLPIERHSILSRVRGLARRLWRFRKVLRQEQPDVVLSFMGEANIINTLLARHPIVSVHNHLSSLAEAQAISSERMASRRVRFEAIVNRILIWTLFRRATVVAVANAIGQELAEHFRIPRHRIVVIPNAVDARKIQAMSAEPADCPWRPELPVLITAGRLTAVKGQWHLIRALAEARKKTPCQLAILGTGELEGYLRRLVKEMNLEDAVFFLGWQANPFKFMSRAKLFVLPSLSEAFGLVLLEAMACGLPVISSDCPGEVREIVAPGTKPVGLMPEAEFGPYGILVSTLGGEMQSAQEPPSRPEIQLAEVIVQVLTEPALHEKYRTAVLHRVQDFDHETFVEKYQRLIDASVKTNENAVRQPH